MSDNTKIEPLLRWFDYRHLPEHLQIISKSFSELAVVLVTILPSSAERTLALRDLLSAKDNAVRAAIDKYGAVKHLKAVCINCNAFDSTQKRDTTGLGLCTLTDYMKSPEGHCDEYQKRSQ